MRFSPGVELRYHSNDDHIVHRSRKGMAAEDVERKNGAGHVHRSVDERVPDGLCLCAKMLNHISRKVAWADGRIRHRSTSRCDHYKSVVRECIGFRQCLSSKSPPPMVQHESTTTRQEALDYNNNARFLNTVSGTRPQRSYSSSTWRMNDSLAVSLSRSNLY